MNDTDMKRPAASNQMLPQRLIDMSLLLNAKIVVIF